MEVVQLRPKAKMGKSPEECTTSGTGVLISSNDQRMVKRPTEEEQDCNAPPANVDEHAVAHHESQGEGHRKGPDVTQ